MRMLVALLAAAAMVLDVSAPAAAADAIESDLAIAVQGAEKRISLDQALALLNVPSVSVALIDGGRVAFARAYGKDATPETLYQAASLSKFVAAIGAMRLVEQGRLKLDADVNDALTTWNHLARPEQCVRRDAQGHLARPAQHDRWHRRAGLPRL
jgi:CubicO group peptidase (beta-lactamase class C family)